MGVAGSRVREALRLGDLGLPLAYVLAFPELFGRGCRGGLAAAGVGTEKAGSCEPSRHYLEPRITLYSLP